MASIFLSQGSQRNHQPQDNPEDIPHFDSIGTLPRRLSRNRNEGRGRGIGAESTPSQRFHTSMWKLAENLCYIQFLAENEQLFRGSRSDRKSIKINVLMSNFVGTRSPDQCRSHHQKMMKYHHNIPHIIRHVQGLLQTQENLAQPQSPPTFQETEQPQPLELSPQSKEAGLEGPLQLYDLDSWMILQEKAWEQRANEEWLNGVEDIYGNF